MSFMRPMRWKLASGSHDHPTPDGETCLVETSIVAAGFPYRRIIYTGDWPRCYSNVIAIFASVTHDRMYEGELRQKLMSPFITRLAYTADKGAIERQRAQYMALEYVRRIFSLFCEKRARGYRSAAQECREATNADEAISAVDRIYNNAFRRGDANLFSLAGGVLMLVKEYYSARSYAHLSYRVANIVHRTSMGS